MRKKRVTGLFLAALFLAAAVGCAGAPVRETVKPDMSVPVGKIENNQFTGIRYPFIVSAPSGWKIATEFPAFMIDLGFEKEGLEESQVFIFNPETKSNLQIDFSPAGRRAVFSQNTIESLTTMAAGSFEDELRKDYGKDVQAKLNPTEPVRLKGVPYAAKKSALYAVKGEERDQGWIYAFAEPYQIFILYMVLDKKGAEDRAAIQKILDSFEVRPAPTR
jgi:hypothetical protein